MTTKAAGRRNAVPTVEQITSDQITQVKYRIIYMINFGLYGKQLQHL